MEAELLEPGIHPLGVAAGFVSALLERCGDEWGNQWMLHMRRAGAIDQATLSWHLAATADDVEACSAIHPRAQGIADVGSVSV